jgi:hypothetical protein
MDSFETSKGNAAPQAPVPAITWKNWMNLGMYVANCGVTYASISGIFGSTNTELSKKYQTLITPAGWAFAIWGPIFIWEGVFSVVQLLPAYRGLDSVQNIAPWWWASCAFQVLWSLVFAADGVTLAFILMLSIFVSLLGLLWTGDSKPGTVAEYWLIRAPFSLQCGWIVAASALNFNVFADSRQASQGTLLTLATASLGMVFAISSLAAFATPMPNPVICFVAFWACMGIYSELGAAALLKDPSRFNYSTWPQVVLDGVRGAALLLAILSLGLMVAAAARRLAKLPEVQTKGSEVATTSRDAPLMVA